MDKLLCEKFNKLNVGDKCTYFSQYGRYEAVVISDWQIEQTNLSTGTRRDIIANTTTTTTTAANVNVWQSSSKYVSISPSLAKLNTRSFVFCFLFFVANVIQ